MKETGLLLISIGLLCVFAIAPTDTSRAEENKFHVPRNAVADRYIVVLQEAVGRESENSVTSEAEFLSQAYGGKTSAVFDSVRGYSVEMTERDAKRLAADPRVKFVEQDSLVEPVDTVTNPGWALDRIDQRSLPYDDAYSYNSSGLGVNVYILDSGVLTTHEGFGGRAFSAYDATGDPNPVESCSGHGTGVAGVTASSNFGTARNARIYSVRVLPCSGAGYVSGVMNGVDWVTRHGIKPAVANMSLRANYSRALNTAVYDSIRSGVTYVVAAGNDSDNACNYSPGSLREAITVGGTNSGDQRVYWSNFGSCVDVFAPGEGVPTIWNGTNTATTSASGTSFSSPYVAGAAALFLQTNPLATPQQVSDQLSSNATQGVLADLGVGSPDRLLYSLFTSMPSGGCGGLQYSGSLPGSGSVEYQSGPSGFSGGNGTYSASLTVPDGAVFSVSLEKYAKSRWSTVSSGTRYRGRSGTYRWKVESVTGSGYYQLCSNTP